MSFLNYFTCCCNKSKAVQLPEKKVRPYDKKSAAIQSVPVRSENQTINTENLNNLFLDEICINNEQQHQHHHHHHSHDSGPSVSHDTGAHAHFHHG